ncbi:MAG: response regulator [Methylibium sp.]|uniref:hybrid sensor histidine kinase/response regulator n=1 Tax=Methylibium sp. TaxID=2067992 RepID=UPI0017C5FF5F|nr:hybrid sensor histidine kinase/response regulator [Methylibium sp.]MBA3597849.1 response regulator [Methylibium sp.]
MDISELRAAQARLQEADRRKDEFLAMLAHELRNPLAPISAATEILKRSRHDPDRVSHTANVIERQVRHLTTLVDDLLDVSRVTRGLVTIDRAAVDLRSVMSAALEQVQPLLDQRRHQLHTVLAPGDFFVEGDFHRLVQILTNLLTNAAKYTPEGGAIVLRIGAVDGQSIISVEDNGIGIPPDMLGHVFDLFTQADRTPDRSQGGLGIGLALVRSLVRLHGGSVEAESEGAGRGSTFFVRLPLTAPPAYAKPGLSTEAESESVRGCRVLVVDDNRDAAQTLAELLGLLGHEVTTVADGAGALAAAGSARWDFYILDIGLPDMTGLELIRRLKQGQADPSTTFIALTGYGQSNDYAMSKQAGFDYHMVKPPNFSELVQILGGQRSLRE